MDTPIFKEIQELKNYDSVVAENITFKKRVNFTSISKVKFVGCVFENISDTAVDFNAVDEVEIEDCIFIHLRFVFGFSSRGIKFKL